MHLIKAKPSKGGGAKLQGLRRITRYASQLPGVKSFLKPCPSLVDRVFVCAPGMGAV